jgi:TRAP-type mannitol/chloroaromatic compound transport system substrate-binding protein
MSKTEAKTEKTVDRRKFLKGGAIATGAAAATVAFPQISRAQTVTLKIQSSWSASDVFQEMAQQYVERVEKMSGGRLKMDLLPSGAVVQAFQVQDACHQGVLDAAHTVTAYWYGKNKAASLFGTGPVFGSNAAQILAWIHFGGGKDLYKELLTDILKLNVVGFFANGRNPEFAGAAAGAAGNRPHLGVLVQRTGCADPADRNGARRAARGRRLGAARG